MHCSVPTASVHILVTVLQNDFVVRCMSLTFVYSVNREKRKLAAKETKGRTLIFTMIISFKLTLCQWWVVY